MAATDAAGVESTASAAVPSGLRFPVVAFLVVALVLLLAQRIGLTSLEGGSVLSGGRAMVDG